MGQDKLITVEVAFALPDKQAIIPLRVSEGATAYEAVLSSGICEQFTQIDPEKDNMGIFGKAIRDPKKHVLKAGERVEIYRALLIDPKASRAKRAEKVKLEKKQAKESGSAES